MAESKNGRSSELKEVYKRRSTSGLVSGRRISSSPPRRKEAVFSSLDRWISSPDENEITESRSNQPLDSGLKGKKQTPDYVYISPQRDSTFKRFSEASLDITGKKDQPPDWLMLSPGNRRPKAKSHSVNSLDLRRNAVKERSSVSDIKKGTDSKISNIAKHKFSAGQQPQTCVVNRKSTEVQASDPSSSSDNKNNSIGKDGQSDRDDLLSPSNSASRPISSNVNLKSELNSKERVAQGKITPEASLERSPLNLGYKSDATKERMDRLQQNLKTPPRSPKPSLICLQGISRQSILPLGRRTHEACSQDPQENEGENKAIESVKENNGERNHPPEKKLDNERRRKETDTVKSDQQRANVNDVPEDKSPNNSPLRSRANDTAKYFSESTCDGDARERLSMQNSHSAENKNSRLAAKNHLVSPDQHKKNETELITRLRKQAAVSQLIKRFTNQHQFKWDFDYETNTETPGQKDVFERGLVSPIRDRRSQSSGNLDLQKLRAGGEEEVKEIDVYFPAPPFQDEEDNESIEEECEEESLQDEQVRKSCMKKTAVANFQSDQRSVEVASEDSWEKESQSEASSTDKHETMQVQAHSQEVIKIIEGGSTGQSSEFHGSHIVATPLVKENTASVSSSYEETTVEIQSNQAPAKKENMQHSENLIGSYSLQSPETSKQVVVLDLEEMEPPAAVKKQHAQVIADLQILMQETKNENETKKQRKMKEKILRDILEATKLSSASTEQAQKANLTALSLDEVSDIVTHINLCEQTNTPIRWDLINDIVFPDGIDEEPESEVDILEDVDGAYEKRKDGQQGVTFSSVNQEYFVGDTDVGMGPEREATEMFRHQYRLTEEEMGDVIAHLRLCEETNTEIRWDLIHRIIYPDDNIDSLFNSPMPNEVHASMDDCKSVVTDGFDDKSTASWFSVYAEFDDCASSLTFQMDGDDVKVGKKSKRVSNTADTSVEAHENTLYKGVSERGIDRPEPRLKSIPTRSRSNLKQDPLLRKRVQALQASSHLQMGQGQTDSFRHKEIQGKGLK